MRLPGYIIAFVLALLLMSTTPVGTGAGLHQFDLLHPLFSHLHLVNGRLLSHEQMASMSAEERPTTGVAIGTGDTFDDAALGISPIIPMQMLADIPLGSNTWTVDVLSIPPGREEAPPDPPPL